MPTTKATIRLDGSPVRFSGVQVAERAGVAIIHQELNLVPELTAADNIFLGREPLIFGTIVDRRRIVRAANALLKRLGIAIDAKAASRSSGLASSNWSKSPRRYRWTRGS